MIQDRRYPFQKTACKKIKRMWSNGARSIVAVSPTGSGKTEMAIHLIEPDDYVLWVVHRRELVFQTKKRLDVLFGKENVGVVMAGVEPNPSARIQIGTINTLLARDYRKRKPTLLVLDEAHHFVAPVWRVFPKRYKKIRTLGLTATPERADGSPLGDIFEHLVVVAQTSQLIEKGYLVPARVIRPIENLGNNLAMDPVEAWLRYSEGDKTFAFFGRVEIAEDYAERFCKIAGIRAEVIEAKTNKTWRDDVLASLNAGQLDMVTNVYTMTEGVDVPPVRVALLCKAFGFAGALIQAVGRTLRTAEGKQDAIIIDLSGSTIVHGLPDVDREYSLEGRAITVVDSDDDEDREVEHRGDTFAQEVCNVEMEVASRGALPPQVPLPPPVIPMKGGRYERDREMIRRTLKKQGSSAAQSIRKLL